MKMDINLKDIEAEALMYVLDLIEKDFIQAGGANNTMRGLPLFQDVNFLKVLLKQEITLARTKKEATVDA